MTEPRVSGWKTATRIPFGLINKGCILGIWGIRERIHV